MTRPWFLLSGGTLLGLTGEYLMRAPLGVNVPIFTAVFIVVTARATSISPFHSGLALPMIFFAGCIAWRESMFLTASNTFVVLGLAVLPHVQRANVVLRTAFVSDYAGEFRRAVVHVLAGAFAYFAEDLPKASRESPWRRHVTSVGMGLGMAVPIVLVFGALYSSADPTFRGLSKSVLDLSPATTFGHLLLIGTIGFTAIGYLRGLVTHEPSARQQVVSKRQGRYGLTEIIIPLAGLVLLTTTFVVLQIPYLFGGHNTVTATAGLSYSTYARRGFFELTTATALVVPVLLSADRLLKHSRTNTRIFRIVASIQIALVGILMISAMHRMGLYWREYGFTTTRVYAAAFMFWIGAVLVWFTVTVLRGRRRRFAFGGLVAGLLTLATLNFVNPENFIARVNIARATYTQPFDAVYLVGLSTDAYPSIIENLLQIPQISRCTAVTTIENRLDRSPKNWKGWTVSWQRATRVWERQRSVFSDTC